MSTTSTQVCEDGLPDATAACTARTRRDLNRPSQGTEGSGKVTEVPLAEADPTPERRWNPWEIGSIRAVDTARAEASSLNDKEDPGAKDLDYVVPDHRRRSRQHEQLVPPLH